MRGQRKKLEEVTRCQARGQLYIPGTQAHHEQNAAFDEAVAGFGLVIVDDAGQPAQEPDPPIYLWPCNLPVWQLWQCVQTQWRTGMAGRTGLDYAGVIRYLERFGRIAKREQAAAFECLQVMERAALEEWAEREKQG